MKLISSFILAALLIFAVSKSVSALEEKPEMKGRETEGAMMSSEGTAEADTVKQQEKRKRMFLMPLMMREMATRSVVATGDGGVVVMAGNKLMKFDKDLNLVKEVEIKIDIEGMEKMMMEMMPAQEQCPLPEKMIHKGKMKQGLVNEGTRQESVTKQEAPGNY